MIKLKEKRRVSRADFIKFVVVFLKPHSKEHNSFVSWAVKAECFSMLCNMNFILHEGLVAE